MMFFSSSLCSSIPTPQNLAIVSNFSLCCHSCSPQTTVHRADRGIFLKDYLDHLALLLSIFYLLSIALKVKSLLYHSPLACTIWTVSISEACMLERASSIIYHSATWSSFHFLPGHCLFVFCAAHLLFLPYLLIGCNPARGL